MTQKGTHGISRPGADDDLIQIVLEEQQKNGNRYLMASAALESNLTYLAGIALRFMNARPDRFTTPQINFVRNVETTIDDNGRLVERRLNQKLFERMQIVQNCWQGRSVDTLSCLRDPRRQRNSS